MHDPGPRQNGHPASEFSVAGDEVTCQQFVDLVTDYFEGSLPSHPLNQLEEHLVMCDWCVTYVEQMQATRDMLRKLNDRSSRKPPDSLLAVLRARTAAGQ